MILLKIPKRCERQRMKENLKKFEFFQPINGWINGCPFVHFIKQINKNVP